MYENYAGRKVVLWGKFVESERIEHKLKEKYQLEIAFYIDSDAAKYDNKRVFPTECICGKCSLYYVVVPLSYNPSIREFLRAGGYRADLDYHYFSDCILRQEVNYFEDSHGNKIIGNYQGLKFTFSGFDATIEIKGDVSFYQTAFYLHNDSHIVIGKHAKLMETKLYVKDASEVVLDDEVCMENCDIRMEDNVSFHMGSRCFLTWVITRIKDSVSILTGEGVKLFGNSVNKVGWDIEENAVMEIGPESSFEYGRIVMGRNTLLKIGRNFTTEVNYVIAVDDDTTISIGDDCMFSYDIRMKSNDGHAIFDIHTGENINSLYQHRKSRKIVIGNHVWVGLRATVLYHTVVGDGSIIGASSLVKSQIPNNCIAAGVPARVVKRDIAWCRGARTEDIQDCGQEYIHLTQ